MSSQMFVSYWFAYFQISGCDWHRITSNHPYLEAKAPLAIDLEDVDALRSNLCQQVYVKWRWILVVELLGGNLTAAEEVSRAVRVDGDLGGACPHRPVHDSQAFASTSRHELGMNFWQTLKGRFSAFIGTDVINQKRSCFQDFEIYMIYIITKRIKNKLTMKQ